MSIRSFINHILGQLFGVAMALTGVGLLVLEYHDGAQYAHTSRVIIYTAIFGIGCLIVAPGLVPAAASKLVMLVVDAKKNGLRWTDKLVDEGKAIPVAPPDPADKKKPEAP